MRIVNLIMLSFLTVVAFSQNINQENLNLQNESINGEWLIDLRPTPEAPAYLQSFFISNQKGKTFGGTFYGSIIQKAKINTNWDKVYFAFQTSDASHNYYQSGYIDGDEIFGITYCPGRDFVMKWTGKKKGKK